MMTGSTALAMEVSSLRAQLSRLKDALAALSAEHERLKDEIQQVAREMRDVGAAWIADNTNESRAIGRCLNSFAARLSTLQKGPSA